MFGTIDEPGLIPQCLQRIFRNVGSNIDDKVMFKPIGLENMIPTIDCDLNMEKTVRNYIFKDDKVQILYSNEISFHIRFHRIESTTITDYNSTTKSNRRSVR